MRKLLLFVGLLLLVFSVKTQALTTNFGANDVGMAWGGRHNSFNGVVQYGLNVTEVNFHLSAVGTLQVYVYQQNGAGVNSLVVYVDGNATGTTIASSTGGSITVPEALTAWTGTEAGHDFRIQVVGSTAYVGISPFIRVTTASATPVLSYASGFGKSYDIPSVAFSQTAAYISLEGGMWNSGFGYGACSPWTTAVDSGIRWATQSGGGAWTLKAFLNGDANGKVQLEKDGAPVAYYSPPNDAVGAWRTIATGLEGSATHEWQLFLVGGSGTLSIPQIMFVNGGGTAPLINTTSLSALPIDIGYGDSKTVASSDFGYPNSSVGHLHRMGLSLHHGCCNMGAGGTCEMQLSGSDTGAMENDARISPLLQLAATQPGCNIYFYGGANDLRRIDGQDAGNTETFAQFEASDYNILTKLQNGNGTYSGVPANCKIYRITLSNLPVSAGGGNNYKTLNTIMRRNVVKANAANPTKARIVLVDIEGLFDVNVDFILNDTINLHELPSGYEKLYAALYIAVTQSQGRFSGRGRISH